MEVVIFVCRMDLFGDLEQILVLLSWKYNLPVTLENKIWPTCSGWARLLKKKKTHLSPSRQAKRDDLRRYRVQPSFSSTGPFCVFSEWNSII